MNPQVVVVGSYVQDLTWRCAEFPQAGETVIGRFVTGPGGKGSNQAIAAGRAGAATLFVGAVGRDVFADAAEKFYAVEGIAARFVSKPDHATGTAAILVNEAAQNEIVVALGASEFIEPGDLDPVSIREAKVVVCQHEANLAINAYVFSLARETGVTTVLNPAPMRPDFDSAILTLVDVLIPNETEFVALINRRDVATDQFPKSILVETDLPKLSQEEFHRLCRILGVPTVIVTLGKRGCFVSQTDRHTSIAARTGIVAVDTTGAGDAFVGGFAAGLVKFGGDQVAAAHHGNTVAALSVTKFGTAPSMPTKAEIHDFVTANG